eukprot:7931003-Pyramimonas_sp.AAC.1
MSSGWSDVALGVANILAECPKAQELFGKLDRSVALSVAPPRSASKRSHAVLWNGSMWRCSRCAKGFRSKVAKGVCAALTPALRKIRDLEVEPAYK